MDYLLEVKGMNGRLQVFEHKVVIVRKGLLALASTGWGDKEIYIKSISGIQFKKPGFLTNGYIQIQYSGSSDKKGMDVTKDENTIVFTKSSLAEFEAAKNKIEQLVYQK